jgi:hypothetical protein
MNCSSFNAGAFLRVLSRLPEAPPAEGPRPALLCGIAALSAARPSALPDTRAGGLGARLNRRYLRIRAVQDALGKLDFNKAKPGTALDDFVFAQTDFSRYKKITAEDFSLFDAGLDDFDDDFFTKNFGLDREKTAALIGSAYKRIGAFYYLNRESNLRNPLLMAAMRSLHTSTAFRPAITGEELLAEITAALRRLAAYGAVTEDFDAGGLSPAEGPSPVRGLSPAGGLSPAVYYDFLKLLDGSALSHADGMITTLAVEPPSGSGNGPVLKGTFHPCGKAYTVRLAACCACGFLRRQ